MVAFYCVLNKYVRKRARLSGCQPHEVITMICVWLSHVSPQMLQCGSDIHEGVAGGQAAAVLNLVVFVHYCPLHAFKSTKVALSWMLFLSSVVFIASFFKRLRLDVDTARLREPDCNTSEGQPSSVESKLTVPLCLPFLYEALAPLSILGSLLSLRRI